MRMEIILGLLFLVVSSQTFAKPHYYRFWRGHIAPAMTEDKFVAELNSLFIPETVNQGKGLGLLAYMPVLVSKTKGHDFLADELALVVYESVEKYYDIRKRPRGSAYQDLHWRYFDKTKSRSLVPEEYKQVVEFEKAYDLLLSDSDWQKDRAYFQQTVFNEASSPELKIKLRDYLDERQKHAKKNGILSHLVLITEKYMLEYILQAKDSKAKMTSFQQNSKTIELRGNNQPISFDQGVNRKFKVK
jgi:hypothetical protein